MVLERQCVMKNEIHRVESAWKHPNSKHGGKQGSVTDADNGLPQENEIYT